ncbi:hypothetical protein LSH36_138g08011 [Paralvinella palmiformis]|uniref:MH2 domain-containing protein n=1 Tax=Paralvinella palmiformis TaxID=53620 RepID=A0AAD9JVH5_9ANNE|nr:hypothetical protein LSH36_138g08011 [Paralvinella palmiformis]
MWSLTRQHTNNRLRERKEKKQQKEEKLRGNRLKWKRKKKNQMKYHCYQQKETVRLENTTAAALFIWEELVDSIERFPDLNQQIWAKMFYMEKSDLIGKVYLRDWKVIVNNSKAEYIESVIGLNYKAFDNDDCDEECLTTRNEIGAGIELMRDDEGNVMISNLSENAIIAKDYINPGMSCIGQELKENSGQVPK